MAGWAGKAPPRTRLVTNPPGPTPPTLTKLGEVEDRYPPPAVIVPPPAPAPPIRRVAFSWGSALRATGPSIGLLTIGMGVLVMGRTTLVTMVGATQTAPSTWLKPCPRVGGGSVFRTDPEEESAGICPPPTFPPPAASTPLLDPPLPSSPASIPFFLFFSELSVLPPAALSWVEAEKGREEWTPVWLPPWRGWGIKDKI